MEKMEVNEERVKEFLKYPLQAADVAEFLAKRGVPFRDAYASVARAVKKHGYDMKLIAEEVLGAEAEEALKDPVAKRSTPGAPGNLEPVFEKISKGMERMLRILELRYTYWNCPNS
jgi:argininosuccinate lyase